MSGAIGITPPARALPLRGRAGALLVDVYLGLRLSVAGFSVMLPMLGAIGAGGAPKPGMLAGLGAVAMLFHVYAYLLNDVVDLDVDRREPQRAAFPLVRGALTPAAALAIAAAQLPLAFAVTLLLGGNAAAFALLGAAFVAMTAYDVWGKRCPFPPLTDFVQAVGWAALLLYGAALAGTPGALTISLATASPTLWLAAAVTAYVLLVNGVHGALRDLANDSACGARTTAILLGARISDGALIVPRGLLVYALALHGLLFAAVTFAWRASTPLHEHGAQASFGLLVAVMVCVLVLLGRAVRIGGDPARAHAAATSHLFACMALLAVPLLARFDAASAVSLAAVYLAPIAAMAAYRAQRRRGPR